MRNVVGSSIFGLILLVGIFVAIFTPLAKAQYCSGSYCTEEAQVGAVGSDNDLDSTNYTATATAGDTAVGDTSSSGYRAFTGFDTTRAPWLEVAVALGAIDVGYLSPSSATTTSTTFQVRAYLASGYNVYTIGAPPTSGSYDISPMTATGTSTVGTSQFGINLVANTSPATVGAAPQQVPDATFSFGQVDANYATANNFRYNNGERIAYSTQSSGITTYTISYLFNIGFLEEAGEYVFNQSIVVVATY